MFGQIVIYGLIAGTQVLLITLALYLVQLVSRVINLAIGGIAAAGGYALYAALVLFGWPLWVSIIFAIVVVALLGLVNYFLNEQFTRKQEYLLALLSSFALGLSLEAIIGIIFGADGKSLNPGVLPTIQLGPYQMPISGLAILFAGLAFAVIGLAVYFYTPFGRRLRSISENQITALSLGINQSRVRMIMYLIAAAIAGLVGCLAGFNTALIPSIGVNLNVMAFCALLIGGINDLRGTIVASYLLGFIPELVVGVVPGISANWRFVIMFAIAAVFLVIKPRGIFSFQQRLS